MTPAMRLAHRSQAYALPDRGGWTPSGRIADLSMRIDGDVARVEWDFEEFPRRRTGMAVFVNSVFEGPILSGPSLARPLEGTAEARILSFDLVPAGIAALSGLRLRRLNTSRRVRLSWGLEEGAEKITMHKNPEGTSVVDLEESAAIALFTRPVLSADAAGVTVGGRWVGDVPTGTIVLTCSSAGGIDAALFTWSYGSTTGGPITARDYAQFVVNGVTVLFDASASWTFGQTITITAALPTEMTTEDLPNGLHRFQAATWRKGLRTLGDAEEITVLAVPGSAELEETAIAYVDGSGTVQVGWRIPAEPGIREAEILRNYPEWGIGDLDARPVQIAEPAPGSILIVTVEDLQPGLNRIGIRILNDGSYNDDRAATYELFLDENLNRETTPRAPFGVGARQETDLSVTFIVWADPGAEEFVIYHDNRTGTIDYNTPIAVIANTATEYRATRIESQGHFLPGDGTYLLAARGRSGSTTETNTTVISPFEFDTTLPPPVTDLTLELVEV